MDAFDESDDILRLLATIRELADRFDGKGSVRLYLGLYSKHEDGELLPESERPVFHLSLLSHGVEQAERSLRFAFTLKNLLNKDWPGV